MRNRQSCHKSLQTCAVEVVETTLSLNGASHQNLYNGPYDYAIPCSWDRAISQPSEAPYRFL